MVSTRSQLKNNITPMQSLRRSPRCMPALVKEIHAFTVGEVSLNTSMWKDATVVAEVDSPTEDYVESAYVKPEEVSTPSAGEASPTKSKRVRKMPEYKSIVRTRSQKLKEAEVYHEKQLERLAQHWYIMRREPKINSHYGDESELATYIQNLRAIHPENLKPEFVARVTEVLPWFKWNVPEKTNWCSAIGRAATFGALIAVVLGAVYVQVKLQDRETMKQILLSLNNLRSVSSSYA